MSIASTVYNAVRDATALFFEPLTIQDTPRLQKNTPKVKSLVSGFSITIERKKGCVLKTRPKNSPEETPYTDSGVDEHFEVTVTFDPKQNVQFPNAKGPWKFLLTNSMNKNSGYGFSGHVHYQPYGDKFTMIEVVEAYEDYRHAEIMGHGRPSPEMVVWVRIHIKQANGTKTRSGSGIAGRPSSGYATYI